MKTIYLLVLLFSISISGNANEWSMESEYLDSENAQETTNRVTRGLLPSPFYWETGDNTKEFTIGKKDGHIYWIDKTHNDLQNKPDVFFAYVLGKSDYTSALVRAYTIKDDSDVVTSFTFDVIKGRIDKESFIDEAIGDVGEYVLEDATDIVVSVVETMLQEEESKIDYITELSSPEQWGSNFAFKMNAETLPDGKNSENFDNVKYDSYEKQDEFLSKEEINGKKLADFLPSHLLYSPEDYVWDPIRFKLVDENEVSNPYIDSELNKEGTIRQIFGDIAAHDLPDDRTPILFIHGWQGSESNAFDILHDYGWPTQTLYALKDSPTSGENYWRNLLTYMYRDHYADFKKFKPYVYHYPSYKHVKFNARMLKDLLDNIDDEVMRKGIENNQLIIVAHSMGTIVSRSLMEEFGYLSHVKQFISLAGVHHGSPGAMASLVGSSVFVKDVYTPGACDLIVDNYDGFIDQSIIEDIHNNSTAKELLEQREACGSVIISDRQYNTEEESFDLHYLNLLGVKEYYVANRTMTLLDGMPIVGTIIDAYVNMAVPYHSNPWLLHLNKIHQEKYQASTKGRYYFYAGYVVVNITDKLDLEKLQEPLPDDGWTDWLKDDLEMDITASFTVAGQAGYNFLDSVVLLHHGIFDTSRGKLLKQNGDLTTTHDGVGYDKHDESISNDLQITSSVSIADLRNQPLFVGENSWGANFRIFADYHHDRMLNGGYENVDTYRLADDENNGSGHRYFDGYDVPGETSAGSVHFKDDPLFEQIRIDIIKLSETSDETSVVELTEGSYKMGLNDAKIKCKNDPASCGIIPYCPEIGTHASFSPSDGTLTIPAVDVPDAFGGITIYRAEMSLVPGDGLVFSVTDAEPVQ